MTIPSQHAPASGWATGRGLFASVVLILAGVAQALAGLAAILEDKVYVVTANYVYELDVTGWGWIHLILGVVVALAGVYVLSGRVWARVVGIALAGLSALANFFFIPYYPLWTLLIIALDVFVIWALATYTADRVSDDQIASGTTR